MHFEQRNKDISTATLQAKANSFGQSFSIDQAIDIWGRWCFECIHNNNQVFFIGNGASHTISEHISADLTKNLKARTLTLSNTALLTALGNDFSYEEAFSKFLELYSRPNDLLVVVSSSGESANVLHASKTARDLNLKIVTLSGMSENNSLSKLGDLNFHFPDNRYGIIEVCHHNLLHFWLDKLIEQTQVEHAHFTH